MLGKVKGYSINVYLFDTKFKNLGGLDKLISLRLESKSYKLIGEYFGFSTQRAHQICRALEDNELLPNRKEIESTMIKNLVKKAKTIREKI